ncbi:MAG: protein kinase [Acidobacteriaceae bacterium]|nr:protein kinase [Acidobacteriaceae bacterium]MBV9223216.1 protein kinase [Acidobacteriaceae bacterium]MBV9304991.1 protein kinase [Acidobacteriaceae bacterium]
MNPQVLSHYSVQKPLGTGGMGEVYLAVDLRLGRKVAIKVLPEAFSKDAERRRMLETEARAISRLSHPNIAQIYEFDEETGRSYIVMEFVEGRTLSAIIAETPMTVEQVIDVGVQVADALGAAHAMGIVHRDIKPSNLIMTEGGLVKVLDFGLAKMEEVETLTMGPVPDDLAATATNTLRGTMPYMSPEQAVGGRVTAASDVFSCATLIYELATQTNPFRGPTMQETLWRIAHHTPESLSSLVPQAPEELDRILAKCHAKQPERRYPTARELSVELRQLRDASKRKPEWILSRRGWIASAWTAGLSVALVGGYWARKQWAGGLKTLAVLPFANATGDPNLDYLSEGLSESLINDLSQILDFAVRSRSSVLPYKNATLPPSQIGEKLEVSSIVNGQIRESDGSRIVKVALSDVRSNREILHAEYPLNLSASSNLESKIVEVVCEKLRGPLQENERKRIERRKPQNGEAYQLYLEGRYYLNKRTNEGARRSLEMFNQAAAHDPQFALAYTGISDAYISESAFIPPTEVAQKAQAAAQKALQLEPTLAESHLSRAYISFFYEWQFKQAEESYRTAISLNPNYAPAHAAFARLLNVLSRFGEAQAELRRALELDPLLLTARAGLGNSFYLQRQYDRALESLGRLRSLEPNFALVHINLGEVYVQKKMYRKGLSELQTALRLSGEDAGVLSQIGSVYAAIGEMGKVADILAKLKAISRRRYIAPPFFAYVYAALGQKDEAFEWLERGYAERCYPMVFLNVYPLLDPLRGDPRFTSLLKRVGLRA